MILTNSHGQKLSKNPWQGTYNRNYQSDNKVRIPCECWTQLNELAKQVWDKLSDHDKAIILGYSSTGKLQGQGQNGSSRSNYKANLHEISAFDFLQAHVHEFTDRDNPHDEQEEFQDAVEVPGADDGEDQEQQG